NIARDDGRFILPALREVRLTVIDAVDGMPLDMKHPLGASAFARGPSSQRPGLSGSPGHDVASPSTVPARFPVDNGELFAPGQSVTPDVPRPMRARRAAARCGWVRRSSP